MLTSAQYATLKTSINADPILSILPNNGDGPWDIAAAYNLKAVPDYLVWRTSISMSEIMQNGFDWTRVDNLTIGKARIWEWMLMTGVVDGSRPNVRSGVLAVFGTAADLATRLAVFQHFQRPATRFEKLFATGSGTTTSEQGVGPSTMAVEGTVSYADVETARNS